MDDRNSKVWQATLTPHRSLSRNGFFILMGLVGAVNLVVAVMFVILGAWPIAGFAGLDVLLVWWAFRVNFADARKLEVRGDGNVRIRRETNGRGGKTVTTIAGLAMNHVELQGLLKDLKRVCGAGGATKDGVLELQGDHCDLVLRELAKKGIKAKRAGG